MKQDYTKILTDILGNLAHLNHIQPSEIPHINLYMDQVTGFMEEHLSNSKRFEDDKILTKTMINNYAKNKLLPPPEKKRYSKEHMYMERMKSMEDGFFMILMFPKKWKQ